MTTRKLRNCKYGDRLSNGKCPKKPTTPKTRKLRKCKYGERLSNGKCPKKPTASKTRKLRKCKYGERLSNGKCPKKPTASKIKTASNKTASNRTASSSTTNGIGNMNTRFLVKVYFSKQSKMVNKNKMIDLLGEALIMDADADLQASTMEVTSHTLSFEVVHQEIDDANGTYNRENIIKAIKNELDDVEVSVTRMS